MKELDLMTLVSVLQEMMGPLLWILISVIVLGTVAFFTLLLKEHGLIHKRLVTAQVLSPLGGAIALVIMAKVSSSGFTDAGGPADWFLIAAVFGTGLIGSMVLLYTVIGWLGKISKTKPQTVKI
ncbi:DUF5368 domain-containing protein [Comamonas jiangduensis]|jgi:hypothetical protein|uniref:DUF5368 domain-containing protein n=1 Tax=Comamonas jiangduensis TaxID=1194168 RepID=UPI0024E15AD1|nr:DUF5368 domain-containing protein [Comamonas jiangduensis]